MTEREERNSTIEILRIVAMLFVVGLHYMNNTIGGGLATSLLFNKIWTRAFESVGIIAVNVFVLISGYFLVYQRKIRLIKIIDLYLIMVFYNLIFFFLGSTIGSYTFSFKELVYAILPFLDGRKWFIETYMILLVFAPFLNKLILSLTEKTHRIMICAQIITFSLWPSFLPSAPITDRGYGIINFITLYFIATYIRLYFVNKVNENLLKFKLVFAFLISCGGTFLSANLPYLKERAWDYCYLLNIFGAIVIFCMFIQMKETRNKTINRISTTTLGVYLIHASIYIQPLIYQQLMRTGQFCDSYLQLPHFVICITVQFFICSIIDCFRQKIWNQTVSRWLNRFKFLQNEINV